MIQSARMKMDADLEASTASQKTFAILLNVLRYIRIGGNFTGETNGANADGTVQSVRKVIRNYSEDALFAGAAAALASGLGALGAFGMPPDTSMSSTSNAPSCLSTSDKAPASPG